MTNYEPGTPILLRRVLNGAIYRVTSARVVSHTEDLLVLYWGPGYPIKAKSNLLYAEPTQNVYLQDKSWGNTHLLMLIHAGAAHAVYAMWQAEDHQFLNWYINLQAPLQRTPVGFDTTDYILDICANRERTEWVWKDEEDFAQAIAAGKLTQEQAKEIRAEGERAIRLLQEGPASFYESWLNWLPSENWEVPVIPANWDARE